MGKIILPRRSFLLGSLASLFVAPAVIRSGVLMPIRSFVDAIDPLLDLSDYQAQFRDFKTRFLKEYRKNPDAEKAKDFAVFDFGQKWAGYANYETFEALHTRRWITEFDA